LKTNAWIDRPFLPYEVSANLARDWPDARGMWYNDDKSLSLYVNRNDHMLLCVTEKATNLKNSFQKLADFVKRVMFDEIIYTLKYRRYVKAFFFNKRLNLK
jgi:hypothetical protein